MVPPNTGVCRALLAGVYSRAGVAYGYPTADSSVV